MVENKQSKGAGGGKGRKTRADRSAEALRENLKRRKTQARNQAADEKHAPPAPKPATPK